MNKKSFIFLILSFIFLISCGNKETRFSEKLISAFKKNSINKKNIDWTNFERKVTESNKISKDSAIITALTLNNNPHSYYFIPNKAILNGHYNVKPLNDSCNVFGSITPGKYGNIGYLKIKSFYGNPSDINDAKVQSIKYITEILNAIESQDRLNLQGWLIDLRYNYGGDMWPMLVALSPFFEDKEIGSFKSDDFNQIWKKDNDRIVLDDDSQNERVFDSKVKFKIKSKNKNIAVLISRNTQSAGEAVAIALKALNNVKFFGEKTRGFATSNLPINMGNKELLVLTTGYMHDINGVKYPDGIKADFNTCNLNDLDLLLSKWFYNKL